MKSFESIRTIYFLCITGLLSSNTLLTKPVQIIIPINNEIGIPSLSTKSPIIQGFEVDSLNNIYIIQNDYSHANSHIMMFSGNVAKRFFIYTNPFVSKKLYIYKSVLLTGNFQGKTCNVKFLNKKNGHLLRSITMRSSSVINDFFFLKNFIAIQYFPTGGAEAKYEYYSYDGVKVSVGNSDVYQGSSSFLANHIAEGGIFISSYNNKKIYSGSDLDNNLSKAWVTNASGQVTDSLMIKDIYLGNPLPDIQEFVKFRNNRIWFVRTKPKQIVVTSQVI